MNFHSIIDPARISVCLFVTTVLVACGPTPAPADAEGEPEKAHSGEVVLTVEQVKAIGLVTGTLEKRGLKTSLKANGRLVLPPNKNAQASVLIGGIVQDIPVQEGQHVEKGQVLATLGNIEFLQLQQDYLETQANLVVLTADLKRQQDLHTDQINANK